MARLIVLTMFLGVVTGGFAVSLYTLGYVLGMR